jgi:hypothetical protein
MPVIAFTKRFDTGTLTSGATWEKEYPFSEHYVLHRIYIQEQAGTDLNKSLIHLEVAGKNIFAEDLPAKILGPHAEVNEPLDLDVQAGSVIKMIFKNLEDSDVACYITLWFTTP